jgi:hypothetical protein
MKFEYVNGVLRTAMEGTPDETQGDPEDIRRYFKYEVDYLDFLKTLQKKMFTGDVLEDLRQFNRAAGEYPPDIDRVNNYRKSLLRLPPREFTREEERLCREHRAAEAKAREAETGKARETVARLRRRLEEKKAEELSLKRLRDEEAIATELEAAEKALFALEAQHAGTAGPADAGDAPAANSTGTPAGGAEPEFNLDL